MTGAAPRLPPGFRLLAYDRLGSSNDEAKRLARDGAAAGTIVWPREQTAGRGRRGRTWIGVQGNLYVSFILRPACSPAMATQLGFVAALAVGEAIDAVAPPTAETRYKWPNDVLLNRRKIAGILLESEMTASGALDFLVVGIGVNVMGHPPDATYPTTSLREEGCVTADAAILLETLARCLDAGVERWLREGFAPVRAAWLGRAIGIGDSITARLEGEAPTGRFAGLDADGALLLEQGSEIRRITAGDVFPALG